VKKFSFTIKTIIHNIHTYKIKMTAGAIAVPTVMPLRLPVAGKAKNSIDSNTRIEIRSGKQNFLEMVWLQIL